MFLWLQQSGYSKGTQSEEYNFEDTAANFGKLLFLASVSSRVSSSDVLCSLGPTDEDIDMNGESPDVVTTRKTTAEMLGQEHAIKDPEVTVSAGEAAIGMPSKGHAGKGQMSRLLLERLLLVCPAKDTLFLRLSMMFTKAKNPQV